MRIIREKDTVTKEWSGGTTTELAIYPDGAVYADRDFIWRLSTAVVRDEESTFTALPDYDRLLTLRDGSLMMRHNGGAWYEMKVGDATAFDGADLTESRGQVTDFNLMLRKEKAEGSLHPEKILCGNGSVPVHDIAPEWRRPEEGELRGIYVSDGEKVEISGMGNCILSAGDLALFDSEDDCDSLMIDTKSDVLVIFIKIRVL